LIARIIEFSNFDESSKEQNPKYMRKTSAYILCPFWTTFPVGYLSSHISRLSSGISNGSFGLEARVFQQGLTFLHLEVPHTHIGRGKWKITEAGKSKDVGMLGGRGIGVKEWGARFLVSY